MKQEHNLDNIDINKLVMQREAFENFIYTPVWEAVDELHERWEDNKLNIKIEKFCHGDIPRPFIDGNKAVLFRQLTSPNNEFRRFMDFVSIIGLKPIFLEYQDDKFTSNNLLKYSLGKMRFRHGLGRRGGVRVETRNVIDFVKSDGKKIKNVKTIWGQTFVEFHHELLESAFPKSNQYLFDASKWLRRCGTGCAKDYYARVLALFERNAILFENFVLNGHELAFIKKVFLPAFIKVWKKIGKKPLIARLLSVESQDDVFWISYPFETLGCIESK